MGNVLVVAEHLHGKFPKTTLVGVAALGLLATLPWGAVAGAIAKTPSALFGVVMLPIMIITGISGIFYPISALPEWVQGIAQIFPMYWLGLGVRSALRGVRGSRAIMLASGGGFSVLAADAVARHGVTLPALSRRTQDALRQYVPAAGNSVRTISSNCSVPTPTK